MDFIPDGPPGGTEYKSIDFHQAYLEDGLAGYQSTKDPAIYRSEIIELLRNASATDIHLEPGAVDDRTAYQLTFRWEGVPVKIIQVALPVRSITDAKLKQAERQALYHLLNELRFELERRHFHPKMPAFVPYMVASTEVGNMTLWEFAKMYQQPALTAPPANDHPFKASNLPE